MHMSQHSPQISNYTLFPSSWKKINGATHHSVKEQVFLHDFISDEDYRVSCLQDLELLDDRQQTAFNYLKAYKQCMNHSYNHKVKPHTFKVGYLVLRENPKIQQVREKRGKFEPNWLVPYVITIVYGLGAYQLSTPEGKPLDDPIMGMDLQKLYTQLFRES